MALALADLERLKWQALAASAILASILGLAVVLSWRTVVRPLQAFAQASDRMASGTPGEEGGREAGEYSVQQVSERGRSSSYQSAQHLAPAILQIPSDIFHWCSSRPSSSRIAPTSASVRFSSGITVL